MSVDSVSLSRAVLDARPVRPVSNSTSWDEASAARDRFADAIRRTLEAERFDALVLSSQSGNYPMWVKLEAWLPDMVGHALARVRCELEIVIDARPLNKHRLVYSARLVKGSETVSLAEGRHFTDRDAAEWARFAINRGPKPSNYAPALDLVLELFGAFVPPLRPRHNPISSEYRNSLFDTRMLLVAAALGAIVCGLLYRTLFGYVALALGSLCLLAVFLLPFFFNRVRFRDWVSPQPVELPRNLGHVDSWHAALEGVGSKAEELQRRLLVALSAREASGFVTRREFFGYRTANGFDERERVVVSRGQGQVHIHLYSAGNDLFVGWQAYLNWAQWAETEPVAMQDRRGGRIAYRDIRPGWYIPQQFDLIDLDSLTAVVHSEIEREIRALLREQAIDQEVDFEIERGDRSRALDRREAWRERSSTRKRDSSRIFGRTTVRRTGAGEMKLAAADLQSSDQRSWLARIPPVLLLPALCALGYFWVYDAGHLAAYRFDEIIPPNTRFAFYPLLVLPLAAVLGFGLWLYAGVRLTHALLTIAAIEALTLCTTYTYVVLYGQISSSVDLRDPVVGALLGAFGTLPTTIACLLGLAIWGPQLRERRYWIAGLLLWMAWGAATTTILREMVLAGATAAAISLSLRVLIAACVGYWLGRTAGFRLRLPEVHVRLPQHQSAARSAAPAEGRRFTVPKTGLGLLFVALAALTIFGVSEFAPLRGWRIEPGTVPFAVAAVLLVLGIAVLLERETVRDVSFGLAARPAGAAIFGAGVFIFAAPMLGGFISSGLAAVTVAVVSGRPRLMQIVISLFALFAIIYAVGELGGIPLLSPRFGVS